MGTRRALEMGRRFYGELVKGRTRVRIVPEARATESTTARFLLSPYRSGTTLMRFCLDSHPDLAVPPETDFLDPLFGVLCDEPSMTGLMDLGYDTESVKRKLGSFGRSFLDAYASTCEASCGWLDKSPRYAENPAPLAAVYGDARFLVMHRHPLDQIHSFTRSGTFSHPALGEPTVGRELIGVAADYWARVTGGLRKFEVEHPADTLSIRYEDLCSTPEMTLRSVLTHLGLSWSDRVLEYHRYDHDLGREAGRVSGTRGFSMSQGAWREWPSGWADLAWDRTSSVALELDYDKP